MKARRDELLDSTKLPFSSQLSLETDIARKARGSGSCVSFKLETPSRTLRAGGKAFGDKNRIDMPHRRRGPTVDKRVPLPHPPSLVLATLNP